MVRTQPAAKLKNRLLAALPPDEFSRLAPLLTDTTLEQHKQLEEAGRLPTHVHFPWSGVCSLTTVMRDGRIVEVGTIGNEGLTGMGAYFGAQIPDVCTVVQVPGDGAYRMRVGAFIAEMEREGALYQLVRRYSQALIALIVQSAACNALHDVDQRCARWLLMTQDRAGDVIHITQEYLASMLAVRRSSVSEVAGRLQRAKMIQYGRGRVRILSRDKLLGLSCECYGVVRNQFDRLVP